MMTWLKRALEDREITRDIHSQPPHLGDIENLSELLPTDYAAKRIKRGHA